MIKDTELKYSVGALMYTPASNKKIADAVIGEKYGKQYSLALCLEDTIADDCVEEAEKQLEYSLQEIYKRKESRDFYLPKIFIRVRRPEQVCRLFDELVSVQDVLCGYIIPKYSVENAIEYNQQIINVNEKSKRKIYMMPILESGNIVDYASRRETLLETKKQIDLVTDYVLNVRVGGNDFSNHFAVRRHYDETIYDILPIANILSDIITVFAREYVVSGPVWEFFSSDNNEWKYGLEKETKLDKLNGFIGKTVIHPKQISVVNEALKVSKKDYQDALSILGWDQTNTLQVGKSIDGERMNEVKTHGNWAMKTIMLAQIYGIN